MSHNTFGHLFRVTTWGESHGPALGCVVDGCPPGLNLTADFIQGFLDQRRPGTSRFVTQRREPDRVNILSGVFEDDRTDGPVTTGTPISLMIENQDQRSKDSATVTVPAMPTRPMTPSMACATIAAAGAVRHVKPPRGSQRAQWRGACSATQLRSAARWFRSGRTR